MRPGKRFDVAPVRTARQPLRVRVVFLLAVIACFAASCGGTSTAIDTRPGLTAAQVSSAPTAVTEEVSGQLSDFFGPSEQGAPEAPSPDAETETPAETAETAETPETAESDAAEPTAESSAAPDSAAPDATPQGSASSSDPMGEASISLSPESVPAFGVTEFQVRGSGFPNSATVIVLLCVVPGEAITAATDQSALAGRLNNLDADRDCDVAGAVAAETDPAGSFMTDIAGLIEQNTMVYAAEQSTGSGPFVLVQIST